MTERYLSVKEVAERFSVTTAYVASRAKLPEPDARIGEVRGWRPETIDTWWTSRPGRGVGGGRPRKNPGSSTASG